MNLSKSLFSKTLLTLWLMSGASMLNAALLVYRIKGDVRLINGSRSTLLQRHAELRGTDVLNIAADAVVEILDSDTKRIYSSTHGGRMSVDELVKAAKADAASVTRKTNGRILSAFNEKTQAGRQRYERTGLSAHNTEGGIVDAAVADGSIPYLRRLIQLAPNEEYGGQNDMILLRRNRADDKGSFSFAVFNTFRAPLYVNVIDQSDEGLNFYFGENAIAAPRSETVFEEYRYVFPDVDTGYIVIGSDKDFTHADVLGILEGKPVEGNFFYSLLRP